MNVCEHLTITANRSPEQIAVIFEGETFTFAQLDVLSKHASKQLLQAHVIPGDRVALMLPNVPAFIIWYFAALRAGAIVVSISTRLTEKESIFILTDCDAKILVTNNLQLTNQLEHLPSRICKSFAVTDNGDRYDHELFGLKSTEPCSWHDAEPNDAALILYTSGTTGFAKGATLSHMNVRSNVMQFNRLCDMQAEDRILLAVPLFHCFGQIALLNSAFNAGATLVLQNGFDLNESKQLIAEHQVTQLYGVPTMFQLFHESCQAEDLSTIRYSFSAAAKLPVQVSNRWLEKFGQPIYEGYGLTETSPFASYNHHEQYVPGSIGTPIESVEMKIVDSETGEVCPSGELGEIIIRGPNVMLGYWNRPEDTANAIHEGWFYSGDIGRQDEKGYFYIIDRVKDMISVGGLKVYPAETERVLFDHDAISQVAVVGFPDEIFGEKVVAFVVLTDTKEEKSDSLFRELQAYSRKRLANFKIPKHFIPIKEIPRNPAGKVLKTKLREYELPTIDSLNSRQPELGVSKKLPEIASDREAQLQKPVLWRDLQQAHPTTRLQIATEFVQDLIQTVSGNAERPEYDARCLECGLDSLMVVEMSNQIQAEIGSDKEIPVTLVFNYPRICDLAEFLVDAFEASQSNETSQKDLNSSIRTIEVDPSVLMRKQIEAMTEAEALGELMRELESN